MVFSPRTWRLIVPVLPVLGIVVVLYFLIDIYGFRRDLTEDRLYTLNRESLKVMENLEETAHIKLYFSRDLPPRFRPVFQFIKSLMAEYEAYGKGKVTVTYIDPGANLEMVDTAHKLGIFETQANVTEKSRVEMVNIWFGLAIFYADRKEVFSSVSSIENFEYDITAALAKLSRTRTPNILLVGPTYSEKGGFVFDIAQSIKPVYKTLSNQFSVDQLRVAPETELSLTDADMVFTWGLHRFTEGQLYAVDQYIMSGKPLVILASGMAIDTATVTARPLPETRADAFFAHYGFAVGRDLVADQLCTKIKYTDVKPPVLKSYPLFPALTRNGDGLASDHDATAFLKTLVIPWPSTLSPVAQPGQRQRVIARTSERAWRLADDFLIDPDLVPGPTSFDRFDLGLALEGGFRSFFAEPPITNATHRTESPPDTTVLVWGSEHLLTQAQNSSILAWASGLADYLTNDVQLSGINRKENAFRPVRELTPAQKSTYKWLSVGIMPALILLFALGRYLIRRNRNIAAYRGDQNHG